MGLGFLLILVPLLLDWNYIMTVYAVLRINNYSLVNIHFTLDAAINQILRLEPRYDILKMHRDLEDNLTHIESQEHIIQPYNIP